MIRREAIRCISIYSTDSLRVASKCTRLGGFRQSIRWCSFWRNNEKASRASLDTDYDRQDLTPKQIIVRLLRGISKAIQSKRKEDALEVIAQFDVQKRKLINSVPEEDLLHFFHLKMKLFRLLKDYNSFLKVVTEIEVSFNAIDVTYSMILEACLDNKEKHPALYQKAKECFNQLIEGKKAGAEWDKILSGTVIKFAAKHKSVQQALEYASLLNMKIDGITAVELLKTCNHPQKLEIGRQINEIVVKEKLFNVQVCTALLQMYIQCEETSEKIIALYRKMSGGEIGESKIFLNSFTYNTLLNGCVQGKLPVSFGKEICKELENNKQRILWSVQLYSTVINFHARCSNNIESVSIAYREMVEAGFLPDSRTYVGMLNGCRKKANERPSDTELRLDTGRGIHELLLFQEHDIGFKWNIELTNALMGMYSSHSCVEDMLLIFQRMIDLRLYPDVITYTSLFEGCKPNIKACVFAHYLIEQFPLGRSVSGVQDHRHVLERFARPLDDILSDIKCDWVFGNSPGVFISQVSMYAYHSDFAMIERLYSLLKTQQKTNERKHLLGNREFQELLFSQLFSSWGQAEALIGSNKEHNVNCIKMFESWAKQALGNNWSLKLFNSSIGMYARAQQPKEVKSTLKMLVKQRLTPDRITYIHLLAAHSIHPIPDEGIKIHNQLLFHLRPSDWNISLLNSLVRFYCNFRKTVYKAFFMCKYSSVVTPSHDTLSILLNACIKYSMTSLFPQVHSVIEFHNVMSTRITCQLIQCYLNTNSIDRAFGLINDLIRDKVILDASLLRNIFSTCARNNSYSIGESIYKEYLMKEPFLSRGEWTTALYNSLVQFFGRFNLSKAESIFYDMPVRDTYSFNIMLTNMILEKNPQKAIQLFETMIMASIMPDEITLQCVLTVCTAGGLHEEAMTFYHKMKTEYNVNPSSLHLNTIVRALSSVDLYKAAKFAHDDPLSNTATLDILTEAFKNGRIHQSGNPIPFLETLKAHQNKKRNA